jgi:protein ImuA
MSVFADLPAGVWRADGLAVPAESVLPTGLPALDHLLPGGGWPLGALVELLQPQPHALIWSLLSPALAQALAGGPGALVLVSPPQTPFIPSLAAQGLPASRWLRVEADGPGARLWATEQALRCAVVVAVLAWLPRSAPPTCAVCSWPHSVTGSCCL